MPQVELFGNLRGYASASQVDVAGETVRAVLTVLCADNAKLRAAIFDADALRPYVRVMVNGHDIELSQGLDTCAGPDDQIAIFPPIAGGVPVNSEQ
jgi:molybdopterin synthase sulfur carrier subunit